MWKLICLIAAVPLISVTPSRALDLSALVGTIEVQFQPLQSGGARQGCSLVYHVVGQDHVYRQGRLIGLVGNITFSTNKNHSNVGLSLKIGTINALDDNAKPEHPFFAYLQTLHGTTARSKFVQADSPDTLGARIFTYPLDEDAMKVLEDIVSGAPVTIGFNRVKDGLDVLIPLDLSIAETTASDTGFDHRHSDEMLRQFAQCTADVAKQVKVKVESR